MLFPVKFLGLLGIRLTRFVDGARMSFPAAAGRRESNGGCVTPRLATAQKGPGLGGAHPGLHALPYPLPVPMRMAQVLPLQIHPSRPLLHLPRSPKVPCSALRLCQKEDAGLLRAENGPDGTRGARWTQSQPSTLRNNTEGLEEAELSKGKARDIIGPAAVCTRLSATG